MNTELSEQTKSIGVALINLHWINKSLKSLYMALDEFQVRAERGQLSADVVEDVSAALQDELLKALQPITRAREITVCSMSGFGGENPSIGSTKPSKDGPE